MLAAARFGDEISHTEQRSGLIAGMILGAIIVGAVVLAVASGGTAVPAMIAVGAVLVGAGVGGGIGRMIGGEMTVSKGAINKAAATVFVNGILAARACVDTALCDDHTLQLIATGSMNVFIEKFPAARVSDTGACSFKISKGSANVFISEATGACAGIEITPEVEPWLENLHIAVGLIGSFCLGYGALGWAGSALSTGLGFGGSILGSEIGGKYFGKWGAIAGGILGGIIGGGIGAGISRGLGNAGVRGFNPRLAPADVSRNTANDFYKSAGWADKRIADHVNGIDFTKPVETVSIPKGTEVVQWQQPGRPTGNYFAPPGTQASELGIFPGSREPITYVANKDVTGYARRQKML